LYNDVQCTYEEYKARDTVTNVAVYFQYFSSRDVHGKWEWILRWNGILIAIPMGIGIALGLLTGMGITS